MIIFRRRTIYFETIFTPVGRGGKVGLWGSADLPWGKGRRKSRLDRSLPLPLLCTSTVKKLLFDANESSIKGNIGGVDTIGCCDLRSSTDCEGVIVTLGEGVLPR